jgi:hypothetical protein
MVLTKFGRKRRSRRSKKMSKRSKRSKKVSKSTRRRSKKVSKRSKRSKRSKKVSKRRRRRSRRSRRSKKSNCFFNSLGLGFGNNLSSIMGNYRPPAEMSTFQQYIGEGPFQYNNHMAGIPVNLKSNFYENKV